MKINRDILIDDLIERTRKVLNSAEQYRNLALETLNWKSSDDDWSVLECLEHVSLYGDFYNPEIRKQMQSAQPKSSAHVFRSGILGNYFAKSMLPKEKLNKMKTFESMNPKGSALDTDTLDRFINQQKEMLELLSMARDYSLTKITTGITISSWIRLRLGDTFRVVIYHCERHIVQANRVLAQLEKN